MIGSTAQDPAVVQRQRSESADAVAEDVDW
jgi:hypothetical protein